MLQPELLPLLDPGPVPRGEGWLEYVNCAETEAELAALRRSAQRGTPSGEADWTARMVVELGLESTVRPRGRPAQQRVLAGKATEGLPFASNSDPGQGAVAK